MKGELITGLVLFCSCLAILLCWPLGRTILVECLFHPLRKSRITANEDGQIVVTVMKETSHGNQKWEKEKTTEKPEPPLALANTHVHSGGHSG